MSSDSSFKNSQSESLKETDVKRFLTEEEMYDVTDFLEPNPDKDWETSISILEENRRDIFTQLKDIQIYPSKINQLKEHIKKDYFSSKIDPGTAVGCDASLGIGEPTTQLSIRGSTKIILKKNNKVIKTTIGEFIDSQIENSNLIFSPLKGSDIVPGGFFDECEILSVSKDEKVNWCKIKELSRHPANGDLVHIKTESGRECVCTLSHSLLTRNSEGVIPILGSNIKIGDRVPIFFKNSQSESLKETVDFKNSQSESLKETVDFKSSGLSQINNECGDEKKIGKYLFSHSLSRDCAIPSFIFCLKIDSISLILRELFDNGAKVFSSRESIVYSSPSKEFISELSFILTFFNIFSILSSDANIYILNIKGSNYGKLFYEKIGSIDNKYELEKYIHLQNNFNEYVPCFNKPHKTNENSLGVTRKDLAEYLETLECQTEIDITNQALNSDVIWDKVIDIQIIKNSDEKVYDFSVELNETFSTIDGLLIHNTLNSLDYKEHIVLRSGDFFYSPQIGEFIDSVVNKQKENVKIYEGSTEYVDINFMNLETPSVDEYGKMHWKKIEAVTRHPPHGGNMLLKVVTKSGRKVIATKSKSFLLRRNNKIIGVNGSELKIGDRLPITVKFPKPKNPLTYIDINSYIGGESKNISLDREFGKIVGLYIYDLESKFSIDDKNILLLLNVICGFGGYKYLPNFILFSNDDFIKGFISSLFCDKSHLSFTSSCERLIDEIIMVLNMFYIFSHKIENKNVFTVEIKHANTERIHNTISNDKIYIPKDSYCEDDIIPGIFIDELEKEIHRDKLLELSLTSSNEENKEIILTALESEVLFDQIVSIDEVESTNGLVYDLTVQDTRNFTTRDGLAIRDTFHQAGVSSANVTLGVPRTNEILNASKNQKTNVLTFSLLPHTVDLTNLQNVRDKCRSLFEERYIDQCITKSVIIKYSFEEKIEPENKLFQSYIHLSEDDKKWYKIFDALYYPSPREWGIRLYLDKLIMVQYKLNTQKIAKRVEEEYKDCKCVFSPDYIGIIDIYIDTSNVDTPSVILANKKKLKRRGVEDEKTNRLFINDDNKDYYFISRVCIEYILDIKVCGIEGITKVYYQLDNKTKNWKLETEGTNMRHIMNHPDVEYKTVISNNMWEIFNILGIEATRKFLISEISNTISFGGTFIDPAHPSLLADSMTSTGTITSVNRYGISKAISGVLTPASFEQSHQNMLEAPAKGLTDDLSTVSARIITSKHIKIGTGYFGIFLDKDKLKSHSTGDLPIHQFNNLKIKNNEINIVEKGSLKVVGVNINTSSQNGSETIFKEGGNVVEKTKPKTKYIDF